MKKAFLKKFLSAVVILAALAGIFILSPGGPEVVKFTYKSKKVPESFNGYKIGFVTDFHNSSNYEKILAAFKNENPDIICVVGDLVDMNTTNFENAVNFMKGLREICEVYYVYGNHETWSVVESTAKTPVIKEKLKDVNICFLNDSVKTIEKDGSLINLIGYGDSIYDDSNEIFQNKAREKLTALYNTLDKSVLSILLFHRGQYFDMIEKVGYDVTLAGHIHGGIININGIREYILNRHFGNSRYVKGEYRKNKSTMFLSAGIAKRKHIPRIFNPSEINILELRAE